VTLPPFHWWRTVFFLIPALVIATVVLGTLSLLSGLIDRSGRAAHGCARLWSRWLLWTAGVHVERVGLVPADLGSAIFVANHSSHYDTPIMFTSVPAQLRIIAKANLGLIPFVGWHLHRAGHLLVDRRNPGAAVLKKMRRLMDEGASLIVYPEGSRTPDGAVHEFKGGAFLLAIDAQLPLVPISISGSRAVMPRGRLMVCPGRVRVTIHEPIATKGLTRADARALAGRVEAVVASGVSR
jgi:1-acyl-sn-glycerol-3-phosphate acyltransferase